MARPHFPELDSLRGLAIVLVLLFHADGILRAGTAAAPPATQVWLPLALVYAGHTGVSLFFVLSGFLLSLPFFIAAAEGRAVSIGEFYRRRALRILPLYWLVVLVAALQHVVAAGSLAPVAAAAGYALFLNSVVDFGAALWPYSVPWWSLATEVQFYLLLPLLGGLCVSPVWRRLGLGLLLVWGLAYLAYVAGNLHLPSVASMLLLRTSVFGRTPLFAAGILAAFVYRRHGATLRARLARMPLAAGGGADVLLLAAFTALALLLRWTLVLGFWEAEGRPLWRVGEAACWGTVLLALLVAPLRSRPLLVNPLLDRLGQWSYSIFLLHVPLLVIGVFTLRGLLPGTMNAWTPANAVGLAAICLAIVACSALTYRWIERPFLARKERPPAR